MNLRHGLTKHLIGGSQFSLTGSEILSGTLKIKLPRTKPVEKVAVKRRWRFRDSLDRLSGSLLLLKSDLPVLHFCGFYSPTLSNSYFCLPQVRLHHTNRVLHL